MTQTATKIIKRSYGNYSSSNYGAHSLLINIGRLTLYFSYDTVVGFEDGIGQYYCENCWGTTTGKHLNWLCPDKKLRLPPDEFETKLQETLEKYKLSV
jgi:hypothetical protein